MTPFYACSQVPVYIQCLFEATKLQQTFQNTKKKREIF